MIDLVKLRCTVAKFESVWFPLPIEDNPKFWFQARNAKFRHLITDLCSECLNVVEELQSSNVSPVDLVNQLRSAGWSNKDLVVLAILLDQMPRNALAINFGRYADAERTNVGAVIDDSYALEFASHIKTHFFHSNWVDMRIVCFYSLIFRHSNRFDEAREVLLSLQSSDEPGSDVQLPPLAQKFWSETQKRQDALGT